MNNSYLEEYWFGQPAVDISDLVGDHRTVFFSPGHLTVKTSKNLALRFLRVFMLETLRAFWVRCHGPGVGSTPLAVGAAAVFTVETAAAGRGKLECQLLRPDGRVEPIDAKFNGDRNMSYTCSYVPSVEGKHRVVVRFSGREISSSPFDVSVEGRSGDASKVTTSGPGLQRTGVLLGKPTFFDLFTAGAGRGSPEVVLLPPGGRDGKLPVQLSQQEEGRWRCSYTPDQLGLISANVLFAGAPVPGSPFGVRVSPASDPRRVRASGRGLQQHGVRVGDTAHLKLCTDGAGEGALRVQVIAPGGSSETVDLREGEQGTFRGSYVPRLEGRYIVALFFDGHEIPRSPFEVNVLPEKESSVRCFGSGLRGGVVNAPAVFTVETNGETGTLGFSVEGPSQAAIQCKDNGDGSADVTYLPTAAGEYAVHVLCGREDVPHSPWMVEIAPRVDGDPTQVEVSGPGVQPQGVAAGETTSFQVDAGRAGSAPLRITVTDDLHEYLPVDITEPSPGHFNVQYTAAKGGKHTVQVEYGAVAVPGSPFRVQVAERLDASLVRLLGPALQPGVRALLPTSFTADTHGAGRGDLGVTLREARTDAEVPVRLVERADGTLRADLVFPRPGPYTLEVTYGGQPVPQSPLTLTATAGVDVSKIKVEGLEPTVPLMSQQRLLVRPPAGVRASELTAAVTDPCGTPAPLSLHPSTGGLLVTFVPAQLGLHWLSVRLGDVEVLRRQLTCVPAAARAVRVRGAGLRGGLSHRPATFVIDTRAAGQGGLGVTVEGPSEVAITCRDNGDGTCDVAYLPTAAGQYSVNVHFNEEHVPGSPFTSAVYDGEGVNGRPAAAPGADVTTSGSGVGPYGTVVQTSSWKLPPDGCMAAG